ncbi:MAG: flagellar basal-body MS-ring/collar protein FliF [Comamonadaceae bacterium]
MSTALAPPSLLDQLRVNSRLPLMLGVSAAVAAMAALWLWSRAPDYGVLYSNLSDRDGGAIIASLQQMNIPYKFSEGGGALLVASNKVPEARLRLAAQGLPKGGNVGFELMDNQKFGTSQFAEQINYQRALEGELARSINSISAVSSARVHLALPKASLFVRDQKKPSASVVLSLHPGRTIDDGQISALVHLISSSVPELSAKSITVVDQNGNLLSAANAEARGLDTSQLKYAKEIEQGYIRRIEAILQPIVGNNNVHAQVSADIDFSIVENTDEKYRPNSEPGSAAIRSQQVSESGQQGSSVVGGVPGALSNQPPGTALAPVAPASQVKPAPQAALASKTGAPAASASPVAASAVASAATPVNARKEGTTNFELDHSIRHVQQGAGAIKRLSVAVLVNYRVTQGAQGKRETQALTPAELEQIKNLVKETMGFSAERGDSVNVVNSPFATEPTVETPEVPWWRQSENIDMAKVAGTNLALGLLALYLLLGVLRPLLRKLLQPSGAAAPATPATAESGAQESADAAPAAAPRVDNRQNRRHQDNVQYAQQSAAEGPQMVAMLVKNWMDKKDG